MISSFFECPRCNYIDNNLKLGSPQVPCPNCNVKGLTRGIFPGISPRKLQEMISYFYSKASGRTEDLKTELVNKLREKTGHTYDTGLVVATAKEIQKIYEKAGTRTSKMDTGYGRILGTIKKRLFLQSEQQALAVVSPLLCYSDTFEEHKAVVILTCTLLERLFTDLLVKILYCKGTDFSGAVKKTEKLQSFGSRCGEFKKATGLSFEEAISKCSTPAFFSNWDYVRKKRNNFIHKSPYAINIGTTRRALNLAENSFSVFAHLQNCFCVSKDKR